MSLIRYPVKRRRRSILLDDMPRGYMKPERPEAAPRICEWPECKVSRLTTEGTYKPIRIHQKYCCHSCKNAAYSVSKRERMIAKVSQEVMGRMVGLIREGLVEFLDKRGLPETALPPQFQLPAGTTEVPQTPQPSPE